jgi:hypothetical protein
MIWLKALEGTVGRMAAAVNIAVMESFYSPQKNARHRRVLRRREHLHLANVTRNEHIHSKRGRHIARASSPP